MQTMIGAKCGLVLDSDGAARWSGRRIVTHIPVFAVSKIKGTTDQKLESVNENLQTATRGLSLPPALEMALVGHRHIVQTPTGGESKTKTRRS